MQIQIEQLAAFSEGAFSGNPAAVCVLERWLPDALMQAIARENNLSETAFTVGREGQFQLRWFTPSCEVDLCGHATLAAAHVVFGQERDLRTLRFDTRSGALQVQREGKQLMLDCPAQPTKPCEAPAGLSQALGAKPLNVRRGTDWLAVFTSEAEIRDLSPDLPQLAALDGRGVIVTAPGDNVDIVSRFFAPGIGIDEDPVTGSTHCALAPYWAERLGKPLLEARQLSERGGRLTCQVVGERVLISGQVTPYLRGHITVAEH
jgi:PhzF family phenazine biosynthesis protein